MRSGWLKIAFLVVVSLSIGYFIGVTPFGTEPPLGEGADGTTSTILPIRSYQQETEYSCGGAVVRALLDYFEPTKKRTEASINTALGTRFKDPKPGTQPRQMIDFLKGEGFEVLSGEEGTMGLIYHYLDQGIPVLVLDNTWGGHWRLVVGYGFGDGKDRWEDNVLYLVDPEHRTEEPSIDKARGLAIENESRFFSEWYENRLYDRDWERFYIVAYPKGLKIATYEE